MTNTKLSNKQIALSVLTLIICQIILAVTMFLMIVINVDGKIAEFFTQNTNNIITVAIASVVLTVVIYIYFYTEDKNAIAHCSKIFEIYFILSVSFLVNDVICKYISSTASPLLFFPLITSMFLNRKSTIFLTVIYGLQYFIFCRWLNSSDWAVLSADLTALGGNLTGVHAVDSFTSLLVIVSAGVLGIFLLKGVKTRMGSVMVAMVMFIPTVIINTILHLSNIVNDTLFLLVECLIYSMLDCIFSVLLFLFFMPLIEVMFSEITPFRLRELTSDKAKLIKKLKQHALGTYNHCVVVAQLAEACASAINEDPELARAAAYYHDIGKLKNPEMFAENQSEYDLHKELTPELSVDIIRSHAKEGAKLIRKYKLPEFFADIAIQHHGTLPIKYFYAKALKMSDGELNAANYSYSGPTPTSKIAAIIMIADASEAAARSLSDRSPEKVAALVSSLVEERMNLDQFVDCDITMRELTIVTQTVINQLAGVYHSRVKYPKLILTKNK